MAETKTLAFPFINRGLVQKVKASMLQAGQYRKLVNLTSVEEGSLQVEAGTKNLGGTTVGSLYHTLDSLKLSTGTKRYVGSGTDIHRGNSWSTIGASAVASAVGLWGQRWSSVEYDAGRTGKPWIFFATPNKVIRDDGSQTTLPDVGIKPPTVPAKVFPQGASIVPIFDWESHASVTVSAGTPTTHHRFGASVSSVSNNGSYYAMVFSTVAGLMVGMLIKVGSTWVVVDKIEGTTVYAYFPTGAPSGGQSVDDYGVHFAMPSADTYTITATASGDLSFGGVAEDGYSTSDYVHLSIWMSAPEFITDMRFQLDVSNTAGTFIDYYEKVVTPSRASQSISAAEVAETVAAERQRLRDELGLDTGDPAYWEYINALESQLADQTQGGVRPVELGAVDGSQWAEISIPKSQFLKVGAAGTPTNNWSALKKIRVVIRATASCEIIISSTYGIGGKEPQAVVIPYDYRYTYFDPLSNFESNPSAELIEKNRIAPWRQAVGVLITGTGDSKVPTSGSEMSVRVYRRGGTLPDDYRLVGSVTNPGSGSTATFIDNAPDRNLVGAKLLEFDNNPPVTSRLPIPLTARISTISGGAGAVNRITLSGIPDGFGDIKDSIRVGSEITVGTGVTREVGYVHAIPTDSSSWVDVYLQNTHTTYATDPGEMVECTEACNTPCDLVCQVGTQLFLAGDDNNPHVLYQSKNGVPDAWPVLSDQGDIPYFMPVEAPTNPIKGIAEHEDNVLVMKSEGLHVVRLWQGIMQSPEKVTGAPGLIDRGAWCKADRSTVYVSHDGVYELRGYQAIKRSEAIDAIFNGRTVAGVQPIDKTRADEIHIAYRNHVIHLLYVGEDQSWNVLKYETLYDRWWVRTYFAAGGSAAPTALYVDVTENKLYLAESVTDVGTEAFIFEGDTGTSDGWTSVESDGQAIDYEVIIPTFDLGDVGLGKVFKEVMIEIYNPHTSSQVVGVRTYYDHSETQDVTDLFGITAAPGRARYPLSLQAGVGKEAYAIAVGLFGSTKYGITLHSVSIAFHVVAQIQTGRVGDWDDLGHPYDKRLYTVTFTFETDGQNVTLNMDTISGIDGNTKALAEQTFIINAAAAARGMKTFEITDGKIVKLVRVRPTVTNAAFKLLGYDFQREPYPPDVVPFTEWDDGGSPFEKYPQQLTLDVDTGGVAATVKVQADGSDLQTLSVTTTVSDRRRNITLDPSMTGKKFRLLNTPGALGKFQLFSHAFKFLPVDRGAVEHTHGWDSLGHPYDKRIKHITFEYESSGGTIQVKVDTISGIGGTTVSLTAHTFTLSGTGHAFQTFDFPTDTFVKAIRIQPVSTTATFELWGYTVDKDPMPPDKTYDTPWYDGGVPWTKHAQEVNLDIDTGGVAATITVQSDGTNEQSFQVTTTYKDRERNITINPLIDGKKFRLLLAPGSGGKTQLFGHRFGLLGADPGAIKASNDWDDLDWPYDKELNSITIYYDNSGGTIQILIDTITGINGTTVSLAAHTFTLSGTGRGLQNFSFPVDTIVKMIRVRPLTTSATFQMWRYQVRKENMPPDVVPVTPETDLGYPCPKILRAVILKVNTGGVEADVAIDGDGTEVYTGTVNTTLNDRTVVLSPAPNIIKTQFRVRGVPGTGGKFQVFDVDYQTVREPCPMLKWDSYEQVFGYSGYKLLKRVWLEYQCDGGIRLWIYRDDVGVLQVTDLPPHAERETHSFFVPRSNGLTLNKSISYRFYMEALNTSSPFKFYRDGSRVQTIALSGDQHSGFQQHLLWQAMEKPV